jgi:hypothetical protein
MHHSGRDLFAVRLEHVKRLLRTKGIQWLASSYGRVAVPGSPGPLYDLTADSGEEQELFERRPEIVAAPSAELESSPAGGRINSVTREDLSASRTAPLWAVRRPSVPERTRTPRMSVLFPPGSAGILSALVAAASAGPTYDQLRCARLALVASAGVSVAPWM